MVRSWIAGLIAATTLTAGCSRIASQAIAEIRGAQAETHVIQSVNAAELAAHQSIEFRPAQSSIGSLCPPKLLSAYDAAAVMAKTELAPYFPGGTPSLEVDSQIIYFQKKGLLSAAQCLARVRLTGSSGTLWDAIITAESGSFAQGDEEALAEACVEALVELLSQAKDQAVAGSTAQ